MKKSPEELKIARANLKRMQAHNRAVAATERVKKAAKKKAEVERLKKKDVRIRKQRRGVAIDTTRTIAKERSVEKMRSDRGLSE